MSIADVIVLNDTLSFEAEVGVSGHEVCFDVMVVEDGFLEGNETVIIQVCSDEALVTYNITLTIMDVADITGVINQIQYRQIWSQWFFWLRYLAV